ncbi:MAG: hypothetical protein LBS11_10510 [Oscillospiraceae bacterium]|jgi:hypothetical protein|nr:hypothetical protein [Oscillospiraceae bacterium]
MEITLKFGLNSETLALLQMIHDSETKRPSKQLSAFDSPQGAVPAPIIRVPVSRPAPAAQVPAEAAVANTVTLTDVREAALKLSKSGKQETLKAIFEKYGAKKLSDIAEERFPALLADLESVWENIRCYQPASR